MAAGLRRLQGEEPSHSLIQIAAFIFERDPRVFAVREQQVEDGRLGVQAVAEHHVKGARIRGARARQ
jgi:hypothetical protein